MSETDTLTELVAQHPRLTGLLFSACLLLSAVGPVAAGGKVGP